MCRVITIGSNVIIVCLLSVCGTYTASALVRIIWYAFIYSIVMEHLEVWYI